MNFSQLHERLRLELLRRIEREALTASLLARKAGIQQPHISNFLRSKRRLSIGALDRVLAALELSVADLLDETPPQPQQPARDIPLVSQEAAMDEVQVRASSIKARLAFPPGVPTALRAAHGARRPTRERFVAVRLSADQAAPMQPRLEPNGIVFLDRHATLPTASASLDIYAVRVAGQLQFSYLSFDQSFLILRPHAIAFPIQLLPVPPNRTPADFVTGRVCAYTTYF